MSETRTVRVNLAVDIEVPAELPDARAEEAGRMFGYIVADSQVMNAYALPGPHVAEAEPRTCTVTGAEAMDEEATEPIEGLGDLEFPGEHDGRTGNVPRL